MRGGAVFSTPSRSPPASSAECPPAPPCWRISAGERFHRPGPGPAPAGTGRLPPNRSGPRRAGGADGGSGSGDGPWRLRPGAGRKRLDSPVDGRRSRNASRPHARGRRRHRLAARTLRAYLGRTGAVRPRSRQPDECGDIYISGGIVPKLGDSFDRSGFRARFEDKGRFSDYLRAIPTCVVTAPCPALTGLRSLFMPD